MEGGGDDTVEVCSVVSGLSLARQGGGGRGEGEVSLEGKVV